MNNNASQRPTLGAILRLVDDPSRARANGHSAHLGRVLDLSVLRAKRATKTDGRADSSCAARTQVANLGEWLRNMVAAGMTLSRSHAPRRRLPAACTRLPCSAMRPAPSESEL